MSNNDPRGPIRTITKVTEYTGTTKLTLSCGHVGDFNQIFHYKVGASIHCFACGQPSGYQPVEMPTGTFISETTA